MYYIGIDPGSVYTGVAVLCDDVFILHAEYAQPLPLWRKIRQLVGPNSRSVVEDMIGTGRRDKHIVRTIKIVGFFQWRLEESGTYVEVIEPNARKPYVSLVPKAITGKDEISAAAHALALRERTLRG